MLLELGVEAAWDESFSLGIHEGCFPVSERVYFRTMGFVLYAVVDYSLSVFGWA